MDRERAASVIESILFVMGEAVEIERIAQALELTEEDVRAAVALLEEKYASEGSGLALNWYEDAVQLSSRPSNYEYLIRIAKTPKKQVLTDTLLETLSIIAFKQPVTRLEVENIRGVNSDFAISKLVSYDLVREVGRRDAPGRPMLFGTTEQFLRSFGISSIGDLPEMDMLDVEELKEEAEQEINHKLEIGT
ncbi:MAG: SMC-Scp complex subunit ScpB [Lachnospiraceae bacterium]|nr:SMC-Scp complex subunit ScpB [Lachnospiraceae bacterium]